MNATEILNIAIKGILNSDDYVIITVLEHNSVLRPLYEMEAKGVELTIVEIMEQATSIIHPKKLFYWRNRWNGLNIL